MPLHLAILRGHGERPVLCATGRPGARGVVARCSCWTQRIGMALLAGLALGSVDVAAQADLNCGDFTDQLEAQSSLNSSYPDDPNRLDADGDWVACEDYFDLTEEEAARVVPANLVNNAAQDTPGRKREPAPAPPPPADDTAPAPIAAPAVSTSRIEPPADLMAQVAACEVVAVSSRSIAAAGCPGVGTIVLRPPAGTPRMRSQVIIRPGAAFGVPPGETAAAAQVAREGTPGKTRDLKQRAHPRKKQHRAGAASTQGK